MRSRQVMAVAVLTAGLLTPPSAAWAGPGGDPVCALDPKHSSCLTNYQVQRGDWLWKIARKHLRANGFPTNDSRFVKRNADAIYDLNRSVIGSNPSRLRPGVRLVLPSPL